MIIYNKDTLAKILQYIQNNGSMPESLHECKQEELPDYFTYLLEEGLIIGKPIRTGTDHIVLQVIEPQVTQKGLKLIEES